MAEPVSLTMLLRATEQDGDVWARPPLPRGTPLATALGTAADRELALWRLKRRPPDGLRVVAVHRLAAPSAETGKVGVRLRNAVRGGVAAELSGPDPRTRVLDAIARLAGACGPVTGLRLGAGGAVLARVTLYEGQPALLRMAPAGGAGDPQRAAAGLRLAARAGLAIVPRPLSAGLTYGIAWTAETLLPGRRPRRLGRGLACAVADVCARLPRGPSPPSATTDDLTTVASLLPDRADALRRLARAVAHDVADVPGILRHGDLWAGNLLTDGGLLSGLVDWDAAHPSAVPGADVLHLVAAQLRHRTGLGLGEYWTGRPWRSEAFGAATERYWPALGLRPHAIPGQTLGVAWWASEVAGTLARYPQRAGDERWLSRTVDPVLAAMG